VVTAPIGQDVLVGGGGTNPIDRVQVFTASRRKWSRLLLVFAAFVALGLATAVAGQPAAIGWVVIGCSGTGLVVSAWQLIVPGRLVVTETEIEVRNLWRRWSRDLARCGPFLVWRAPTGGRSLVVFDHPDDESRRGPRMNQRACGHSSALPDTYGRRAGELARVLNEARAQARSRATNAVP
jgi:hypothetical protein